MNEEDKFVLSSPLASRKRASFWFFPFATIGVLLLVWWVVRESSSMDLLPLGIVSSCVVVFVYGIFLLYWCFDQGYEFYPEGLIVRYAFSKSLFLFSEIESYRYYRVLTEKLFKREPEFSHRYLLRVVPERGKPRTLKFDFKEPNAGESRFLHFLKIEIFLRMEKTLEIEGSVPWTDTIHLTSKGVEWESNTLYSKGMFRTMAFREIGWYERKLRPPQPVKMLLATFWRIAEIITIPSRQSIDSIGLQSRERVLLEIYKTGEAKPELVVPCDGANYYPGLEIFNAIFLAETQQQRKSKPW